MALEHLVDAVQQVTWSPLKVILTGAVMYFSYRIFEARSASGRITNNDGQNTAQEGDEIQLDDEDKMIFRDFTPKELIKYNGKTTDPETNKALPIYIAVSGTVYDVTKGASFYGPEGPYGIFSGRDASRGLAKGELDSSLLTDIDDPIDTLDNLTPDEKDTLEGWNTFFEGKYPAVGKLVENKSTKEDEETTTSEADSKQE